MLSNAYFLAKIRFDTAENEPAENLQKFVYKIALPSVARHRLREMRVGIQPQLLGELRV